MNRKIFVFTLAFLTVALLFAACASAPVVPIGNATGSATASAPGFGGDVTVTITMADGYITDAVCTGDGESPTIGGPALLRAPNMLKKYNSAQLDTISGATITTLAISEAAQTAINKIVAGN